MTKITPEQIEEVRELLARATPCHVALPNKVDKEKASHAKTLAHCKFEFERAEKAEAMWRALAEVVDTGHKLNSFLRTLLLTEILTGERKMHDKLKEATGITNAIREANHAGI